MVRVTDIRSGYLKTTETVRVTEETFREFTKRYQPRAGDTVFSRVGSYGNSSYIAADEPLCLGQNTVCISPRRDVIDPFFLYAFLTSPNAREQIESRVGGASQPTISLKNISTIEVTYPSIVAQRRIASILSAYDDLIENNTRRIAILEEMARRIYEEWFVRYRFPGHEGVRMVKSELGLVPKGWAVQAASTAMGINPSTKVPKDGLKPFLAMNCLSDSSMLIDNPGEREGNAGSKFRNGDTLFARITPCLENGKTGFVQFLPSDEAVAFGSTEFIVLRSQTLTPEFVYLLARSEAFRENAIKSMSGASGRQRVREACFDTFLLANPDQETLAKFANVTRPMFLLIQSLARKSSNLRTTRDLLLPRLISGELDVSALPEPEALAA
jgi:type I restriction enzyme, S subunit